ncbi:hypothetical protein LX32DRAFT_644013 [Colletotrichum zoysiae]|uniref:Uncharacterized protein n=1 Tax=Colletotrichum zoysiae TaxID=1216348 RepID=A0AAD9H861_9PEZI|nr:hypothetical protein LX32DRAFT_644013 [Colletotrichum zoysiae]
MRACIMKLSLVLTISYLITAIWAGGYQNCLERVWLYQSFLIDQKNPVKDQQIGYQCDNWRQNKCIGKWVLCRGKKGVCTFDEFQQFLGNTPPGLKSKTQAVNSADGKTLDGPKTAVNCIWAWRDKGAAPYNFKGYKATKYGRRDFNDFIYRIGQINNDNYNKPDVRKEAGDAAFARADFTLNQVTQARVADHGRHLIPAARNGLPGVNIVEKDMGPSPFYRADWTPPPNVDRDTERFRTVDWEATINNSPNPAEARESVRKWLDGFYRGTTPNRSAVAHWEVLRAYKTIKDRTNRCRKR